MSSTKNPDVIEDILNADSEERLKLIRENSDNLSVSDLNEISLRLISNLTSSVDNFEKHRIKKKEILEEKSQEIRQVIDENLLSSSSEDVIEDTEEVYQLSPSELVDNEETVNSEDGTLNEEIVNKNPSNINKHIIPFLMGIIITSLIFITSHLFTPESLKTLNTYIPAFGWIIIAVLSLFLTNMKAGLFGSALTYIVVSYSDIQQIVSSYFTGNLNMSFTAMSPLIISFILIIGTFVWKTSEEKN
jgi:hypothetical protein